MLFAGHETFHIRDGWLYKGVTAVKSDPLTFAHPHATDTLGVGRNMVKAIRYWLVAAGLATETTVEQDGKRRPKLELSPIGKLIVRYDPHLEEDVSVWLVHHFLSSNQKRATAWYWTFNHFPLTSFDSQTFVNYLSRWISEQGIKKTFAVESLKKDLNCIARTYSSNPLKNRISNPEDASDCPLSSLGLIDTLENSGTYRINVRTRKIPPAVMAFAVCSFAQIGKERKAQIGLRELSGAPLSPGRLFALSPDGVIENIDELEATFGRGTFRYVRTAGMNILEVKAASPDQFLVDHYKRLKV